MITLHSFSKKFQKTPIISDLSLDIKQGDFWVLVGPSGVGKTTLLKIFAGLDHKFGGDFFWKNKSSKSISEREWSKKRRSIIGVVFQRFYLFPELTVRENIQVSLKISGEFYPEALENVADSLGIGDILNLPTSVISGGQSQRVALARALVRDPDVLILDEPTAQLDDMNAQKVLKLLSQKKQEGKTIIVSTHDKRFLELADTVHDMGLEG